MTTFDTASTSAPTPPPSGQQWTIAHGAYEATVVEIGGGIRSLTHDGSPVLWGYPLKRMADAGRGQILTPWPNRIRDGKYTFDGVDHQLALTEPARGNASHGLVRWLNWEMLKHTESTVTVGMTLHPQPGWDWTLQLRATYALDDDGLSVTVEARNLSASACPFGWGMHPYLTAGETTLDDARVEAPVTTQLDVDDRLLPTATSPADAALAAGTSLDGMTLDTCFTDLTADADGCWRVTLSSGERSTTLWAHARTFPYLQLFTGDSLPEPRRRASGLAVEPMTCPAGAFASGESLIRLEPGTTWTGQFGVGVTA